ncbi:YhdH/YhfP family quinone oxidoreductase [Spirochaeta cellobiosiphila]|uniref:YhdH/YhfP family quinone oxidoreductase n=1 Tax=Spirochaeta cellobiosiphila TaxID=504483 RepID=UPI00048B05C1|nr:YhdH/YhfP family quinone oxidoreductase [Spirochaeta cellobiosiphila]
MSDRTFKAYLVEEQAGQYKGTLVERSLSDLPEGDLLIKVHYSSLNYKDALSNIGNKGVTRSYPHTPGIDASGVVVSSNNNDAFKSGDQVIVTGYDLGMNCPGGFGEYIQVPAHWAVPLPEGMSLEDAMAWGTAGLTAAMAVNKVISVIPPTLGPVVVTGSTGGVGSVAIRLLKKLGYEVHAVTGKTDQDSFLHSLGATSIVKRQEWESSPSRVLNKSIYAGAIDTLGGPVLENILTSIKAQGAVSLCGNASSGDLHTSVYPFILRGVSLFGIDSQNCPDELRRYLWTKMADEWRLEDRDGSYRIIEPTQLGEELDRMIKGNSLGRSVLKW